VNECISRDLYYDVILIEYWWSWSRPRHSVFRKENTCVWVS